MWPTNRLTQQLKMAFPVIQAGMAGGVTTPELVAAVSNAGGLGQIGAGYLTLEQLQKQIEEVQQFTTQPFGVNLFVPEYIDVLETHIQQANDWLAPVRTIVGVEGETRWRPGHDGLFDAQIDLIIATNVPVCSFTFGVPSTGIVKKLRAAGVTVIGTATTVAEAYENEAVGVDAVVVQGSEAGGHRGTFLADGKDAMIGTMALVPQVVDTVHIPVIAAGGIMDARGVVAALVLGADAVQMGTAFVTATESGAHEVHKQAILQAKEDETVVTSTFSGKPARGIQNDFITTMAQYEGKLPPYPVQNALTKQIRAAAAKAENPAYMSLWCGQYPRASVHTSAKQIIDKLVYDVERVIANINHV